MKAAYCNLSHKLQHLICTLAVIISYLRDIDAFFFFNQKKSVTDEVVYATLPVSTVRGILPNEEEKYLQPDNFQCRLSKRVINQSFVNDEYCDCDDGSDEPGTSACSYLPVTFTCVNKGFRSTRLFTSRVDDGICDCCDGSDEGNIIKCPNTCDKVAAQERVKLQKELTAYLAGNKIYEDLKIKVNTELQRRASSLESYKKDYNTTNSKLASMKVYNENQRIQLEEQITQLKASAMEETKNILQPLYGASEAELAHFMVALFNSIKLTLKEITDIYDKGIDVKTDDYHQDTHEDESYEAPDHDPYHDRDLDDSYGDYDHHAEQTYDDDRNKEHQEHMSDTRTNGNSDISSESDGRINRSGEVKSSEVDLSLCTIYQATEDIRVKPFCTDDQSSSHDRMMSFLINKLLIQKKPFREIQLLIGYYKLHVTFEDSSHYVNRILQISPDSEEYGVCPNEFESLGSDICQLEEKLKSLYEFMDLSIDTIDPSSQLIPLSKFFFETKASVEELVSKLSEAKDRVTEAESAASDLNHPFYPILGYKDVSMSVKDGQYSYTVTFLNEAKQDSVLLGKYDTLEEQDNGNYIMKFKEGQYCYNFGARSADVHITCGSENKLLSAQEPSTCYYLLHAESPIACTDKYAIFKGLNALL